MEWIAFVALVAFALYAVMCCVLYVMQDRLLYFPTPEARPGAAAALLIHSGGIVLKVWQLHAGLPRALIYFGGNAEDVAAKIAEFAAALPDRAIYLVHYRGYGGNAGTPSEQLLVADAQAIYDDISRRHEQVAVMGRSLGSGVASAVAATRPVEKLILVTPYDSIVNGAADHYGWVPVRWLVKDSYDSVRRMRDVHAPVLAVVAARDDVILRSRSDALVAAIPAPLRHVKIFPEATHNDINLQPGYRELLREFLARGRGPAMPTLVLIPGLDGTGDFFPPLLESLGDDVRTHVVRYPVAGAYDYATCQQLVRAKLPADEPYVLLGESFSGPVAISLAAQAPPGLAGIILCCTFVANPRPRLAFIRPLLPFLPFHGSGSSLRLSRFLVLGRWITPAIRELHQKILSSVPANTIRRRLEAVADCDVRESLAGVRVPIMCLAARHDRLIPRAAARLIRRQAPAATLVEIEAPHCLLQCEPRQAATQIRAFLYSCNSRSKLS